MKAMVLCAGFGTRLGDLTREIPKPMLDINGQPMLGYILANLKRHGFDEVAVNLHFKPEIISNYLEDGASVGLQVTYSFESELLGTAGGVKKIQGFFEQAELFLVHYGDVITDQDLTAMIAFHRERKALATLLLHRRAKSNSIVTLDAESRIIGFLERPSDDQRRGQESPWVNSGVCLCAPEILQAIPENTACDLPRDIFPGLVRSGRLFGFPLSGYRCAIDSPERLAQARETLAQEEYKFLRLAKKQTNR